MTIQRDANDPNKQVTKKLSINAIQIRTDVLMQIMLCEHEAEADKEEEEEEEADGEKKAQEQKAPTSTMTVREICAHTMNQPQPLHSDNKGKVVLTDE
mmetsp:Transcript_46490/g.74517  ORF Transcript_46490/g.74517 Transcript_46490/m.74517 type:complete len:98 (+) Transcript_46490:89-382(+)